MLKKLKEIFSSVKPNKKTIGLFFVFLIAGLTVPLFQAHAQWIELIAGLPGAFFGILIYILVGVVGVLMSFSASILQWVVSPGYISISYTGPDNVFVTTGWTLVRDFANLIFILILVVIGLTTALRLKEYETTKLLRDLILIALLINFTPVIAGLIIDASNVVMNFFLQGFAGFADFNSFIGGMINKLSADINNIKQDPLNSYAVLLQGVAMLAFVAGASVIFLLFAMLFALRYVAIWILVILSPIAFLAYILPRTRGTWTSWWKNFIQWCVIGIVGAFFLYLSEILISELPNFASNASTGEGIMDNVLPYLIPVIFMYIGFYITISSSPGVVKKSFSLAKTGALVGGGFLAYHAISKAMATKRGQKMAKGMASMGGSHAMTMENFRKHGPMAMAKSLLAMPVRKVGKKAMERGKHVEKEINKVEEGLKPYKGDADAIATHWKTGSITKGYENKIGVLKAVLGEGGKDWQKIKNDPKHEGHVLDAIEAAVDNSPATVKKLIGVDKSIISLKERGIGKRIQKAMIKPGSDEYKEAKQELGHKDIKDEKLNEEQKGKIFERAAYKKVAKGIKRSDIENFTHETMNEQMMEAIIENKQKASLISDLAIEGYTEEINNALAKYTKDELVEKNPVLTQMLSKAGANWKLAGINPIKGLETPRQYRKFMEKKRGGTKPKIDLIKEAANLDSEKNNLMDKAADLDVKIKKLESETDQLSKEIKSLEGEGKIEETLSIKDKLDEIRKVKMPEIRKKKTEIVENIKTIESNRNQIINDIKRIEEIEKEEIEKIKMEAEQVKEQETTETEIKTKKKAVKTAEKMTPEELKEEFDEAEEQTKQELRNLKKKLDDKKNTE